MTPTEKARRADALYQCETKHALAEMVVHREADLEDARAENAELRGRLDELTESAGETVYATAKALTHKLDECRDENAKLREERDMYRDLVGYMVHPDIPDQLAADNDKLRELVEDMLDCIDIQIAFERVPARWMQDEFTGRARELGIEVDE